MVIAKKNNMEKEMRNFLISLPEDFDNFTIVNGEVAAVQGEFYVRIDKPVVQLSIDETSKELLILHQTEDEINDIQVNDENT